MRRLLVCCIAFLALPGSSNSDATRRKGEQGPRRLSVWSPLPREGSQPLLIVLCEFKDESGKFTGTDWKDRFFGQGGFADFYSHDSYGKLNYHGAVVGLEGGSGAPVVDSDGVNYITLPEDLSFYAGTRHGFDVSVCQRTSHAGIAHDAILKLDDAGFDFGPYANPTTKMVENIIFIAASKSYHKVGDLSASFLSTAYELKWIFADSCDTGMKGRLSPEQYFVASGGYMVNAYTFCTGRTGSDSELAVMGVCVHEHGHALGLQDWYGVGQYSLMHAGTWGPDATGDYPAHFSAWDRMMLGWLVPREVFRSVNEVEYLLEPINTNPDALKLTLENSEEYYIVENRQELAFGSPHSKGLAPNFCPGVLIWHIDGAIANPSTNYWTDNTVNAWSAHWEPPNPPAHNGVTVKEADKDGSLRPRQGATDHECDDSHRLGTDTFEGKEAELWDGQPSGVVIRVLSQPDNLGRVRVGVTCPKCPEAPTTTAQSPPPETDPPVSSAVRVSTTFTVSMTFMGIKAEASGVLICSLIAAMFATSDAL